MSIFKNLYNYRELLKTNVKKDIRGRYKGSFLGILWSFLNPLLQVVVYWIVFPYLFGRGVTGENYLIYLITGIIPWTFFMTSVNMGTSSIKANGGIIKKVYFPREILPISVVLSGLVNFFISSEITASLSFSTLFMYVFSFYHRSLCKYSLCFSLFLNVKETDRIFRAICLFSYLFYNTVSIFPDGFSSKLFLKNFTEAPHLPRPACRPASSY